MLKSSQVSIQLLLEIVISNKIKLQDYNIPSFNSLIAMQVFLVQSRPDAVQRRLSFAPKDGLTLPFQFAEEQFEQNWEN